MFFRCLEKVFEEERYENKKGKGRGVTTNYIYSREETGRSKIGMIKFLALTLYLVVRITLTLISSPVIVGCFRKVDFQEFNLVI